MNTISVEALEAYRDQTFRTAPGLKLNSAEDAVAYANERGFLFFWPIKEVMMPSLWTAVAGERPVADEHDDPGHVTWGWKDALLNQRRWYYARVLRRRNTIISMAAAPYFYALSENYGSPEEDYLLQYEEGRMTLEARLVYEALLEKGPLDSLALRKAAHLTSRESDTRFNKALDYLQRDFKVLPVGVAEAGAWRYAFIYDLTARYYPEIPEQARMIGERQARTRLAEIYLQSVGAVRDTDISRLFGWPPDEVAMVIEKLESAGQIQSGLEFPGKPGAWIGLPTLVQSLIH